MCDKITKKMLVEGIQLMTIGQTLTYSTNSNTSLKAYLVFFIYIYYYSGTKHTLPTKTIDFDIELIQVKSTIKSMHNLLVKMLLPM